MIGWLSVTVNPAKNWSFVGLTAVPEQIEKQ
jgi:hypothetical protein